MPNNNKDSCINEFDPNALDENQAISKIVKSVVPIRETETINIKNAVNRSCATNIKAEISIPSFKNSAMDGYAVNLAGLKKNNYKLTEIATSLAGKPYNKNLKKNETVRVMTGALVPDNSDAVIMKEMTQTNDQLICFSTNVKKNQNIRFIGEDIKKGQIILKKGDDINYSAISILSSLGVEKVKVIRKPIVNFFSTGDELIRTGGKLKLGQIYDSNRYLLHGLLSKLPVEIKDLGIVKDKKSAIITKLTHAAKSSDIIISTGGVSVGDADFIKDALEEIGKVNFWKISIKPGRPLAFGKIKNSLFFGLPGNPVSAAVTFQLFVMPAINKIMSKRKCANIIIKAITKTELRKKPGRTEYKRAILSEKNGKYFVESSGLQGSNIMLSLLRANCFIRLSSEVRSIKSNSIVEVIPFQNYI